MQIYHGKSMMVVFVNTLKYEGIRGFYNGMSFPLYSIPILNSVIFLTNELAKKIFPNEDNTENFFLNSFLSGAIAGMFGCLIASPVELVKCRMQIQEKNVSSTVKFKSSIECFKYLLLKDKLYRGLFATILRDVVGYSFQFSGYVNLNLYLNAYEENDEKHFFKIYICGAFAGLCCWQFSYPQVSLNYNLGRSKNNNSN